VIVVDVLRRMEMARRTMTIRDMRRMKVKKKR
jgi:hypothetical protein